MKKLAAYSFLPWVRNGLANKITTVATNKDLRAKVKVNLELTGTNRNDKTTSTTDIKRVVELYGPGDITGIQSRAIVRTEPRDWITNYEPNYLPHIEFYDEDFPWRYTPTKTQKEHEERLQPWLALIVLKEDEFENIKMVGDSPLPSLKVHDTNVLPPVDDLWAWAHVHVHEAIQKENSEELVWNETDSINEKFKKIIDKDPDRASSRIISPRRLEEKTGYHAFLVPSYKSGVLAGLGLDPNTDTISEPAWTGSEKNHEIPYYYRWYFRTSTVGDFEYLVRLLKPGIPDKRLGKRDMDVSKLGAGLDGVYIRNLRLGGALKRPGDIDEPKISETFEKFPEKITKVLNLANSYREESLEEDPNPLVTAPLYGKWHAFVKKLENKPEKDWVHELNLDPRNRVPAGFGTKVIKENQEKYMQEAWVQMAAIIKKNAGRRTSQLAEKVAEVFRGRLEELPADLILPLVDPLINLGPDSFNLKPLIRGSKIPNFLNSPMARRIVRPKGPMQKRMNYSGMREVNLGTLINETGQGGGLRGNPERGFPIDIEEIFNGTGTGEVINIDEILKDFEAGGGAFDPGTLPRGPGRLFNNINDPSGRAVRLRNSGAGNGLPGSATVPANDRADAAFNLENEFKGIELDRYKEAMKDHDLQREFIGLASERKELIEIDVEGIGVIKEKILKTIDPANTIVKRDNQKIQGEGSERYKKSNSLDPIYAYPEFVQAMYKPLKDISSELFLPGIQYVKENSITLLETNQKFIEAYMVGLNHEFARELLWREYPTYQNGSYFRQFWDVNNIVEKEPDEDYKIRQRDRVEELKDIPRFSDERWKQGSKLGAHDNRDAGGKQKNEVVMVIRGELLKKFPNTLIYARKAEWEVDELGNEDKSLPRKLHEEDPKKVNSEFIKNPLYQAKVDPDIYFVGLDLTVDEARGYEGDAGWFFVIQEIPGEPRFGLDVDENKEVDKIFWNDLNWSHVDIDRGNFLSPSLKIELSTDPGNLSDDKKKYRKEDKEIAWDNNVSSAELAYILYQAPVLIAVHACELLPEVGESQ